MSSLNLELSLGSSHASSSSKAENKVVLLIGRNDESESLAPAVQEMLEVADMKVLKFTSLVTALAFLQQDISSNDIQLTSPDNNEVTSHVCDLCFKAFTSAQALGGHMSGHKRRQEVAPEVVEVDISSKSSSVVISCTNDNKKMKVEDSTVSMYCKTEAGKAPTFVGDVRIGEVRAAQIHSVGQEKHADVVVIEEDVSLSTDIKSLKLVAPTLPIIVITKDKLDDLMMPACIADGANGVCKMPLSDEDIAFLKNASASHTN